MSTLQENRVKYLQIEASVRYWEDSSLYYANTDTLVDQKSYPMPFRNRDLWEPLIDVINGKVVDWPIDVSAEISYKVVDQGNYYLLDKNKDTLASITQDYVPVIACPEGDGYGDYIYMNIDCKGYIENWHKTFEGFDFAD